MFSKEHQKASPGAKFLTINKIYIDKNGKQCVAGKIDLEDEIADVTDKK